ncbi:lactate utilization protein B/C [Flavobacterium circumlabens]|uniref:L-lactate dehydrogenase complex protein LldG n=1 Tax=Flavobacterium circumlabens TaxID=2133765 RepID=A0A4Y7UG88_9FLAO|nr:LUD domain-containing protein [Flavobacterium circumlabens]TCN59580.1 L-lactate dehydrogenase complex protein LldG [Flavobacterium circumlabens]TEB44862.1 lactate utilization protein B/C [Flavobacterium circumlabens]
MTTRENILNAISSNQPNLVPLPIIYRTEVIKYHDNYIQFKSVLESIGGKVELINNLTMLEENIKVDKVNNIFIINTITAIGEVSVPLDKLTGLELEKLEKVYIKGCLGVAENGAVWISENQMKNRLLPFICQHLILIINKEDIVATMHDAYDKIDVAQNGFGVFIAGPSKTADIEQSLVIGAHGARSATVYVVE